MIRIIAIGRKHEPWLEDSLKRYQKRLKRPFDVEWVLLPHSSLSNDSARKEESERILSRVHDTDHVVLLDETGDILTSPELSSHFDECFTNARPTVLVIGGAYGVTEDVIRRANFVWSLSKLVFPHQLVRLILVEQIYRSQEISRGGSYHHQ